MCSAEGVMVPGVPSGDRWETGDKNRDVTDDIFRAPYMFCEESLGNFNAKDVELFRNGSVHESIA